MSFHVITFDFLSLRWKLRNVKLNVVVEWLSFLLCINDVDYVSSVVSLLIRTTNQLHHIKLTGYCLPYIRLPKTTNQYMYTLKMATSVFAETSDNFQHSTRLIPGSRSCALWCAWTSWLRFLRSFEVDLGIASSNVPRLCTASYHSCGSY
jgi:hypothetical protein